MGVAKDLFDRTAVPFGMGLNSKCPQHRGSGIHNGDGLTNHMPSLDPDTGGNPWNER